MNQFEQLINQAQNLKDFNEQCSELYEECCTILSFMDLRKAKKLKGHKLRHYVRFYKQPVHVNAALCCKVDNLLSQKSEEFKKGFLTYIKTIREKVLEKLQDANYSFSTSQTNDICHWFIYLYPHDKVDLLETTELRKLLLKLDYFVYDDHPENRSDLTIWHDGPNQDYMYCGEELKAEEDWYGTGFELT